MKPIRFILLSAFTILAAGLFNFGDAVAEDKTCFFQAEEGKVHIWVWDEDSEQHRQDKIFEGWLTSEQPQKVTSKTGFIVYNYRLVDDERSYGNYNRICKNGNTIRIP